jgi:hypothetical protein
MKKYILAMALALAPALAFAEDPKAEIHRVSPTETHVKMDAASMESHMEALLKQRDALDAKIDALQAKIDDLHSMVEKLGKDK